MKLKSYHAKRDLKKSHEPSSTLTDPSSTLNFCIQKHAARRLHYDFRLEFKGVLLSWAVPKGPSLDPHDKRLAIHVEDHPLDYQYFEGVIPKGNYGAGTVEIWDKGTYTVPYAKSRKEAEKILSEGLKNGHFAIIVQGERLQGEFVFQKLKKAKDDTSWLLIKKNDSFASPDEIISPKKNKKHVKMPSIASPMLSTPLNMPFNDDKWLFEIKWDGFRTLAYIENGKVELKSRNKLLLNTKFPAIEKDLKQLKAKAIFDGEVVVLDSKGKAQFQLLQNYQGSHGGLYYYVFDLLYLDGLDLRTLPLVERKSILKKYLNEQALSNVLYSDHIIGKGVSFFKEAQKHDLEGIIGKKQSSLYESRRSKEWVKIKTSERQEVIICGFTEPRGARENFGSLIVGVYDEDNHLRFSGHVGGGFDSSSLKDIYTKLKPLIQKKCPLDTKPKVNSPVTWVKPKLICEVAFAEWTESNVMRQPIFQGLRSDKNPKKVKKEVAVKPSEVIENPVQIKKSKGNQDLALTNLDKIYWPKEKYTKGDLINYYKIIAPYILPHLKNRPIVLHRFPNGITSQGFYQKDMEFSHPNWIKTCSVQHSNKVNHYLLIDTMESLLYAVNLGSIEIHPFISRYKKIENPDYCVIDLDPHEVSFSKVVDVALAIHEILEEIEVAHFCKTSGGKGLHILIPLNAKYDFEQSRQFAEIISLMIQERFSQWTSMERDPKKRPKKIYLDCLQNRMGQTIVAPYAVRPRPKATVSTPLLWDEVNRDLDPKKFNIETVPERLSHLGDLLKDSLKTKVNLTKALKLLKKLSN